MLPLPKLNQGNILRPREIADENFDHTLTLIWYADIVSHFSILGLVLLLPILLCACAPQEPSRSAVPSTKPTDSSGKEGEVTSPDPPPTKSAEETRYEDLLVELESDQTTQARKYEIHKIIATSNSVRAISVLVRHTDSLAVYDPAARSPSSPREETYRKTVGWDCRDMLRQILGISPRDKYLTDIESWSEWWKNHSHLTIEQLREEVRQSKARR